MRKLGCPSSPTLSPPCLLVPTTVVWDRLNHDLNPSWPALPKNLVDPISRGKNSGSVFFDVFQQAGYDPEVWWRFINPFPPGPALPILIPSLVRCLNDIEFIRHVGFFDGEHPGTAFSLKAQSNFSQGYVSVNRELELFKG